MSLTLRRLLVLLSLLIAAACSYRAARVLYDGPSRFNNRVIVVESSDGVRSLMFEPNGALQSSVVVGQPLRLELPYTQAAVLGLAWVPAPRRVLVVGLGGGTLPMFLHHVRPSTAIDVVDIDPEVVDAARLYFGFREDALLRVTVQDGRRYLESSTVLYDLVILDAYGQSGVPRHLVTREFLVTVKHRLAPGGLVVANVWAEYANPLYSAMRRTYEAAFRQLCVVSAKGSGNHLLLAGDGGRPLSSQELIRAARAFAREQELPFDLGAHARSGCLEEPSARSAPVLRDDP